MSTKKKKKTVKRIIISIVLILVVLLIARFYFRSRPTATYDSVEAKSGDITTYYSFSGNVDTKNRETVMSDKMMQISELKVKEGDTVKEGDVLATTTTGEEITSTIDGEISKQYVEENAQVLAGAKLMDIVDYDNLELTVNVDEYDISALAVDKDAKITIDALGKEIQGTIRSVSKEGTVNNGVTYFTATIDLAKDSEVKIGMTAEVKLLNQSASNVVTLPMAALSFDAYNKPFVYIEDEKGLPVKTAVETGINDGTLVEIKSGVSDGDIVLYGSNITTTSTKSPMRLGLGRGR